MRYLSFLAVLVSVLGCSGDEPDGGDAGAASTGGRDGGSGSSGSGGAGSGGMNAGSGGAGSGGMNAGSGGDAAIDSSTPFDAGLDAGGGGDGGADGGGPGGELWQPEPGTGWHWQLIGTIDTSLDVAMIDLDLFDTPQATIDALHENGRVVICYFSAGSREEWREDADALSGAAVGEPLEGWAGERWLDVRAQSVRDVMRARLERAASKGCDGVEPDNVDVASNDSGFTLSYEDGLDYLRFLADEAHARGLSVGLKNALEYIPDVQADFDWALNEECLSYDECGELAPFLAAGKAVFHTEYVDEASEGPGRRDEVCAEPSRAGFSTLIKTWDLDAFSLACP